MRNELNDLIRAIVDTRFAVENVAHTVIQSLHKGETPAYRDHKWGRQHLEVMEKVHLGVEAAWHYAKWLQFPENTSRLPDGDEFLSLILGDLEVFPIFPRDRLTSYGSSIASLPGRRESPVEDGKETVMAGKPTVASLAEAMDDFQDLLDEQIGNLNAQIAALEERVDQLESNGDGRKSRRSTMTPEQRKEAGRRLQQARAEKLGLDSIEQLHGLHLRPGQKPTKAQITAVKKEFPVA